MTPKKTTISPQENVHELVTRLRNMSGMSYTGLYSMGALILVARFSRALESGARRDELLAEIRLAFEAEMERAQR